MKLAERFVLLINLPSFLIIEGNLNTILSICSVIYWVINHHCVLYLALNSHLEKVGSVKIVHVL